MNLHLPRQSLSPTSYILLLRSDSSLINWAASFNITDTQTKVTAVYTPALLVHHDTPRYGGFPGNQTNSPYVFSISILFYQFMVSHNWSDLIHLSFLCLTLRVRSRMHSTFLRGNVFSGISLTCPKHCNRFSSVTCNIFSSTSITALTVSYINFLS